MATTAAAPMLQQQQQQPAQQQPTQQQQQGVQQQQGMQQAANGARAAWLTTGTKRSKDWKQASHQGRREMLMRYKFIMKEIDFGCSGVFRNRAPGFQFMDVCSSPGGFSEYVLECNSCRGVGLSLPEELGGHVVAIDKEKVATPDRYHMHFYDVTTIASRVRCEGMYGDKRPEHCLRFLKPGESGADCSNRMDCMILDGSFVGGKGFYSHSSYENDADNPAFNVYGGALAADQALLIAQIIIMCNNLREDGSVVLRLSMTWNDFRNGILCLLRRMFSGSIENYKPRSCHQDKISYYLVCNGFQPKTAQQLGITTALQGLLDSLRAGGVEARLVPFPALPEGATRTSLYSFWKVSLDLYYRNLYAFIELVRMVQEYQTMARQCGANQQGAAAYIWSPCWHLMVHSQCTDPRCNMAHSNEQLHPFVQEAYVLKNGRMEWPRDAQVQFAQLQLEGNPQLRALKRLRALQHPQNQPQEQQPVMQQLAQQPFMQAMSQAQAQAQRQQWRQQQQAQMQAAAQQLLQQDVQQQVQQQVQQEMAMMGAGPDVALGGMMGMLLGGVSDAQLAHQMCVMTMNLIKSNMEWGGSCIAPFVEAEVYNYGDTTGALADMQTAGMQAAFLNQNNKVLQQHMAMRGAGLPTRPEGITAGVGAGAGGAGGAGGVGAMKRKAEADAQQQQQQGGKYNWGARARPAPRPAPAPALAPAAAAAAATAAAAQSAAQGEAAPASTASGLATSAPRLSDGTDGTTAAAAAAGAALRSGSSRGLTVAVDSESLRRQPSDDGSDLVTPPSALSLTSSRVKVEDGAEGAAGKLGEEAGGKPEKAPQVSGYLQWLTTIRMVVADDGYTMKALMAYLGD